MGILDPEKVEKQKVRQGRCMMVPPAFCRLVPRCLWSLVIKQSS